MLSCFDLKSDVTIDEFKQSINRFSVLMQELGLVESVEPLSRRQRHPVMDTATEHDQEYFFIMNFRDREQCDRAVDQIRCQKEPGETFHNSIISKITNDVFICWENV